MTNELYFASETINEIKIDIIASSKGIRKILINKKSESNALSEITQISPEDPKVLNVFTQLKEYFNRQRKEFDLQLEILGTDFQKKFGMNLRKFLMEEQSVIMSLQLGLAIKNQFGLPVLQTEPIHFRLLYLVTELLDQMEILWDTEGV